MGNCHRNNPFNCTQPRSETLARCCTTTAKSSACPSITIREPDSVASFAFDDEQVKSIKPVKAVQKVKIQKPAPTKAEIEADRLKRHAALEQRRQHTKQQLEAVKKLSAGIAALTNNTLKAFDSATSYKLPIKPQQDQIERQNTVASGVEELKPFEFPKSQPREKEEIELKNLPAEQPKKLEMPLNIHKLRDYA